MWKKDDEATQAPEAHAEAALRRDRPAAPATAPAGQRATIGRSITIHGEVSGDEDLMIQGRVEGSVDLKQHSVTVGPDGEVKASIVARVVTVEGRVEGNLSADEQVVLRSSASVHGDISAPRLVLEDGARFRGGVDMGEGQGKRSSGSVGAMPQRAPSLMKETPEPMKVSTDEGQTARKTPAEATT